MRRGGGFIPSDKDKLMIAAKSLRAIKDKMQEFEPAQFRITEVWKIADHALWEIGDEDAGVPKGI